MGTLGTKNNVASAAQPSDAEKKLAELFAKISELEEKRHALEAEEETEENGQDKKDDDDKEDTDQQPDDIIRENQKVDDKAQEKPVNNDQKDVSDTGKKS